MTAVSLIVHRGAAEIGGSCLEIAVLGGGRLVLDVGRPLDAPADAGAALPPSLDLAHPVAGVLLSHAHADHYGLLNRLPPTWPVYAGEATARLIRLASRMSPEPIERPISTWRSGERFSLGPFHVTPLLTDHSAFDAAMALVDVCGKRILYTGDFRTHGRKGGLVNRLMRNPPQCLDALVMEGTNLGSDKPCTSESTLEKEFIDVFKKTKGRVFVAWSAQNIDRTTTLLRACMRSGRTLAVDLYTAEVLEMLAEYGNIPRPGFPNLRVVVTSGLCGLYKRMGRPDFIDRMAQYGLSARKLAQNPDRWVIATRGSLLADYTRHGVVPNAEDVWIWSMWRGYLDKPQGVRVKEWFDASDVPSAHLHTSGHASTETLVSFAESMRPRMLIPVHGTAWNLVRSRLPSIVDAPNVKPVPLD